MLQNKTVFVSVGVEEFEVEEEESVKARACMRVRGGKSLQHEKEEKEDTSRLALQATKKAERSLTGWISQRRG